MDTTPAAPRILSAGTEVQHQSDKSMRHGADAENPLEQLAQVPPEGVVAPETRAEIAAPVRLLENLLNCTEVSVALPLLGLSVTLPVEGLARHESYHADSL